MLSELNMRPMLGGNEGSFGEDLEKEIGMLLREQRRESSDDRERALNMCRSGSAPPTVEGSLSAVGHLFGGSTFPGFSADKNGNGFASEEELRSDPAYLSYYYSNVNLNPRLPPPLLSKEDWRFAQRLQGGSSAIGDRRKVNRPENGGGARSSFAQPPGFNAQKGESEAEKDKLSEWGGDGLIGLSGLGLGSKQKSLAEILQDDLGRATPVSRHPSRPASRNTFEEIEMLNSAEADLTLLRSTATQGPPSSYSYAAALGASLSRSNTPTDPQLTARAPSPSLTPIGGGRVGISEKRSFNSPNSFNNSVSSNANEPADLATALSGMKLSPNGMLDEDRNHLPPQIEQEAADDRHNYLFNLQGSNHNHVNRKNPYLKKSESGNLRISSVPNSPNLSSHYVDSPNSPFTNYNPNGYSLNPPLANMMASQLGAGNLPPLFENVAAASAMLESQNLSRIGNQMPYIDPMYLQYLRTAEYAALQAAAVNDPSPYVDLLGLQKAYLGSAIPHHKSQYGVPLMGKSSGSNHHGYYGNPGFGPLSPVIPNSPDGPGSPIRPNDFNMRFHSGVRNLMGPWHLETGGGIDEGFSSSLLEEFKSNKTKCFELSEIAGHVVEFSADQYGSRFIQQKLETATIEEKNMVFEEIIPQALSLMTDVFGNYVIQKFFEHGMASQRRELASKLNGHVLTLSLQMYGCRVIQKAIEVVDIDQKIKMVEELDGQVMRCVRDQNGNHVIQKCIECVPEEAIQFIISSFFDQVVTLSTHPYGCRVIQRVLEHCKDPQTQSKVMEEILGCVSMLAQDQYGNYVVQHVLEHGKPHERSAIIKELAGKIVQMSQQKFASNVVEKCLTFGGPVERQILVNEMLGTTDENEPLQAMMKDQFANYVVQKVLETCDDQQRELILSRIKVHLNALKKYTYGKHIVARVEKLVAAGERRIAAQSAHPV